MAKVHDLFIVELAEVIKGYGNNPDDEDPFRLSEFYRFYELPNIAVSRENFEKMRPIELECKEDKYKIGYADGYHKAESDYCARTATDRDNAFKMGIEVGRGERKRGRWIPAKERMPKKSGRYIVSGRWGSGKEAVGECEYSTKDGYFDVSWNFHVLAWMGMPKPYKEEQNEHID